MTARELLLDGRKRFLNSLKDKTNWGRNQVSAKFHYACIGALAEVVGELEAEGRQPTPVDLTYEEVTVHMNPPWEEATP